jgi:Kef-type K+ transport system membrane component KefB
MAVMKEMARHTAGRIYLLALVLSVVGFIVLLVLGVTDASADGEPTVVLGWMTMPLVIGVLFVLFWLAAYILYFFFFWPYR